MITAIVFVMSFLLGFVFLTWTRTWVLGIIAQKYIESAFARRNPRHLAPLFFGWSGLLFVFGVLFLFAYGTTVHVLAGNILFVIGLFLLLLGGLTNDFYASMMVLSKNLARTDGEMRKELKRAPIWLFGNLAFFLFILSQA